MLLTDDGGVLACRTKFSYKLHEDLAKAFGADLIGYRPVTTISLAIDTVSNRGKKV